MSRLKISVLALVLVCQTALPQHAKAQNVPENPAVQSCGNSGCSGASGDLTEKRTLSLERTIDSYFFERSKTCTLKTNERALLSRFITYKRLDGSVISAYVKRARKIETTWYANVGGYVNETWSPIEESDLIFTDSRGNPFSSGCSR